MPDQPTYAELEARVAELEAALHRPAGDAARPFEERYRQIVENTHDGIWMVDPEGMTTLVNRQMAEMLGYTPEEMLGRSIYDFVFPEDLARTRENYAKCLANPAGTHLECRCRRKDGSPLWLRVGASGLMDGAGRSHGLLGLFTDITEHMLAEEALRRSEERYRQATNAANELIWEWTIKDGIPVRTSTCVTAFGSPAEGGDTTPWWLDHVHPDDRERVEADLAGVIQGGEDTCVFEYRFRRPDGSYADIYDRAIVSRGSGGRAVRMVGAMLDVTVQRLAEKALRESESKFRAVFNSAPSAILLADDDGRYVEANPAAGRLFGLPPSELIGRSVSEFMPPEMEFQPIWQRFLCQGHFGAGHQLVRPDGSVRDVETYGVANILPGRHISIMRDVTDAKQAEAEIRTLNAELEARVVDRTRQLRALALELTKTEQRERKRLATLLHDHLQQLLVGAKFTVGAMRGRIKDPDLRQTNESVGDLLTEAIAASRSLTFELSPPVLHEAGLAPALEWLGRQMGEKHGLLVKVEADEAASPQAEEVRAFLFDAARELLFNIVKHAGVHRAKVALSRTEAGEARLTVEDHGAGFDPEQLEAGTSTRGGFGLFSIRERLTLLGGRMEITSTPGRGSRFTLTSPLGQMEEPVRAEAAPAPSGLPEGIVPRAPSGEKALAGQRIRVVLADDHKVMREGLARLLGEIPDIEVVGQASDGWMAVEVARQTRPDVVIMDVTMPRLGGFEATRFIRAELPHVRIIGLSMHDEADMAAAMLEAGAEVYLNKAGPAEDLIEAIRGPLPQGTAAQEPKPEPKRKKRPATRKTRRAS